MLTQADAFHIPLADKSVHCAVTSPPYWGLRKYDGDQGDEPLGLEATPERHVERTVLWAREVRRVLRDDGVFWLNYGDCYGHGTSAGRIPIDGRDTLNSDAQNINRHGGSAGNLMLMPHRIALALQQDGWIVRQDFIWHKPNPMPESVAGWRFEDGKLRKSSWRHTRAHEYVFMLVKDMQYFCNQEAVREALAVPDASGIPFGGVKQAGGDNPTYSGNEYRAGAGRNPRSVANIATAPYSGAHYATFPPNLIAPLIRASCPRWACPECGQGWAPVVERDNPNKQPVGGKLADHLDMGTRNDGNLRMGDPVSNVRGYRPTCEHEHTKAEAVPGIVFDPFVGSGTSVMVAEELLRRGIGLDLSRPYLDEQARLRVGLPALANVDDLPLWANNGP